MFLFVLYYEEISVLKAGTLKFLHFRHKDVFAPKIPHSRNKHIYKEISVRQSDTPKFHHGRNKNFFEEISVLKAGTKLY